MLPTIITVNPMAKKRRRKSAHAHRSRHTAHRRRARPAGARQMMGYVVGARKIRRRKLNPFRQHHHHARRYHHRHRHHNPFGITRGVMAEFTPALWGAAGGIGLDVALAYIPLPAALQTGYANSAVRIAGAIGIGAVAGMMTTRRTGFMVGAGALTIQLYSIIRGLLASTVGSTVKGLSGLADFKDYTMGAYMQPALAGPVVRPAGTPRTVGAYMNPAAYVSAASPIVARQRVAGFGAYMGNRGRYAGM
jgi:hypothetical protein